MRQINIKISNRAIYTLAAMMVVVLVGAGFLIVNAYGGSSPAVVGHSAGEIVEADPTVLASVKDGIAWSEISSRPAGLDDGDQGGLTSVPWSIITSRPSGLDDGDQVGTSISCGWSGWGRTCTTCINQGGVMGNNAYCSGGIVTQMKYCLVSCPQG